MKELRVTDIARKIEEFLQGTLSVDDIAVWASLQHLAFEQGELVLQRPYEKTLLTVLLALVHEEEEFRLSVAELEAQLLLLADLR